MARHRRIQIKNAETGSIYHCVSRTVNKEFLWDDQAKEVLRKQVWKTAAFCGVEILAYCIMSNHFHILVRIVSDRSAKLTDDELLERIHEFYCHPQDVLTVAKLEAGLRSKEEAMRKTTRQSILRRMDDLPSFMKTLKQRFSIWYNHRFGRWGTHWGERYHSVVVENSYRSKRIVAAYIALNPVRAGLCQDPKDYRYSSYAEALTGEAKARKGILALSLANRPREALADFRQFLFATGRLTKKAGGGVVIEEETATTVFQQGGHLSPNSIWHHQVKTFLRGLVLGSKQYLEETIGPHGVQITRRTKPRRFSENEDLYAMRL